MKSESSLDIWREMGKKTPPDKFLELVNMFIATSKTELAGQIARQWNISRRDRAENTNADAQWDYDQECRLHGETIDLSVFKP